MSAASDLLSRMCTAADFSFQLLYWAAKAAFEAETTVVLEKILEQLVSLLKQDKAVDLSEAMVSVR